MNTVLSTISLANKSGSVKSGSDTVMREIRAKSAKLVIIAEDASELTKKTFSDKCAYYGVPVLNYGTKEELSAALGKGERSVVCITSDGFKLLVLKKIGELK